MVQGSFRMLAVVFAAPGFAELDCLRRWELALKSFAYFNAWLIEHGTHRRVLQQAVTLKLHFLSNSNSKFFTA